MVLAKVLLYLAFLVGAVLLLRVVASAVFAIVATIWALITTAITLAVLLAIGYSGYRFYRWMSADKSEPASQQPRQDTTPQQSVDPVERAKERYANGELSEAELERRLEYELETEYSAGGRKQR